MMERPMIKRRFGYSLLAIVLCAILYLAHRADRASRIHASTVTGQAVVGTWKADTGDLFQFRSDGTARSRDADSPASDVNYFEWTADNTTVTVMYAPQGRVKGFIARTLGVDTAAFLLTRVSPDSFTLVDAASQIRTQFDRTEDEVLDSAP